MNRCRHVQHLFSAYIDGDLSSARAQGVEAHLAACAACSRELEQWRGILHLVSYHAPVSCPIDCAEAVLQRLENRDPLSMPFPQPTSSRRPPLSHLALTLAVTALLGGGVWLRGTRGARHLAQVPPTQLAAAVAPTVRPVSYGDLTSEGATSSPGLALRVHAPDRLQQAFGRSDSLILAADFAEDDR